MGATGNHQGSLGFDDQALLRSRKISPLPAAQPSENQCGCWRGICSLMAKPGWTRWEPLNWLPQTFGGSGLRGRCTQVWGGSFRFLMYFCGISYQGIVIHNAAISQDTFWQYFVIKHAIFQYKLVHSPLEEDKLVVGVPSESWGLPCPSYPVFLWNTKPDFLLKASNWDYLSCQLHQCKSGVNPTAVFTEVSQGQALSSSIPVLSSTWGPPVQESTGSYQANADVREKCLRQKENK